MLGEACNCFLAGLRYSFIDYEMVSREQNQGFLRDK